ncbi:MAG TPA: WecB/TagA/CpsF family glycosyltransferase [Verrucomicrobiae bacterium]|nr:WecB/TagA/CpsF family glycosyltransferase [Verrucomicrobiae bacterium]
MSDLTATLAPFSGPGLLARAERKSAAPVSILGVPFDHVTMPQAIAAIEDMIAAKRPHYIATANVDFVVQAMEDAELRRILLEADLVLCDGTPLLWVSRWLDNPLPERVAGADLVPELLGVAAEKGYRVFFLGGKPEVAARAVERLQAKYPEIQIAGHYSPPFAPLEKMDHAEIGRHIRAARPDILLVSFGCPKAEKWISMNYQALGVPVSMGVGATIDFLAGEVKRAPVWMQRAGFEWVFRFLQEPGRLGPRYAKDLRRFGWAIGRQLRTVTTSRPHRNGGQECPPYETHSEQLTATFSLQVVRITAPARLDRSVLMRDLPRRFYLHAQDCVVDLSSTRAIDSTALGWLARLHRNQRDAGRKLVLLAPGKSVQRAFRITGLNELLTVANNEAEAAQLLANG